MVAMGSRVGSTADPDHCRRGGNREARKERAESNPIHCGGGEEKGGHGEMGGVHCKPTALREERGTPCPTAPIARSHTVVTR
eukprot:3836104-Prorocentrum_lima.AAC.1